MIRRPAVFLVQALSLAFLPLLFSSASGAPIPAEQVERIYAAWEQALAEHAANPKPRPEPMEFKSVESAPSEDGAGAETQAEPARRSIVAHGDPEDPSTEPPQETAMEEEVLAATDELTAATETADSAIPTLTPTPGLVAIKVAKVVDGKIIEVEVLVTPTPGPVSATSAEQASAGQITGEMAALQQKLKMSGAAGKKKVKFTRTELRKLLAEFEGARTKNPNFDTLMPRSQAMQAQAALQRSSSLAQGGELPPAVARNLLKVLFPPQTPKPSSQPAVSAEIVQEEGVESEESYYVEEDTGAGQPEIYIDPETGQEVYWDGSPVYSEDGTALPPPDEEPYYEEEYAPEGTYYEEEGEYLEEGEVYYEDEGGEVYYEEEYYEEEGNY